MSYVVEINARSTQTNFNETNVLLEGSVGNIREALLQDLQRFQRIDLVSNKRRFFMIDTKDLTT